MCIEVSAPRGPLATAGDTVGANVRAAHEIAIAREVTEM